MPATWLWHTTYALGACILPPPVRFWIVSGASLHSLHLGSYLVTTYPLFTTIQLDFSNPDDIPMSLTLESINLIHLQIGVNHLEVVATDYSILWLLSIVSDLTEGVQAEQQWSQSIF